MTQFFCSIDISWKKLNQHQYRVLAEYDFGVLVKVKYTENLSNDS